MSKIGRKPIPFSSAHVEVNGRKIVISGSKVKFIHELPEEINVKIEDKKLFVTTDKKNKENSMLWGLHRALLANKIKGAESVFNQEMKIVGLGFKAQLTGDKLIFSLGYSHKIEYVLPKDVTVDIDKTGQILNLKSHDKALLGHACDQIRQFRLPEPYKGTGIMRAGETIKRKVGKTGAATSS